MASPESLTPIQVPPLWGSTGHSARPAPVRWRRGPHAAGRVRRSSRLQASRNPPGVGTTEMVHTSAPGGSRRRVAEPCRRADTTSLEEKPDQRAVVNRVLDDERDL